MSTYIRQQQKRLKEYEDCPPLLRDFLRHIVTIEGLSVRTANTYYVNLRLFLRYIKMLRDHIETENYDNISIEDMTRTEIAMVTEDDILNYLYFLANRGNGISTRGSKLSSVKAFYKYACGSYPENFAQNPAAKIERPKLPQRYPKYLSEEEAVALLEAAKQTKEKERNYCITTLLLNCGMRLSELTAINVDSLDESTLKIVGKGNKERTVYLNRACIKAIAQWMKIRRSMTGLLDIKAMFVSPLTRRRLTGRAVEKIIEKELKIAGLSGRGYSPHKLRHTAATLMYDGGADVLELKEILGHEHTTTTEIYTHVNNQRLKTVSDNNPLNKLADKENEE